MDKAIHELATTPVTKVMHQHPVSVRPDAKLIDVVDALRDRYGAILVVDGDKLVGIFTERDLMLRVDHAKRGWHDTPVSAVMTTTPRTLPVTATIAECIALMSNGVFRRVPLLRADGKVEGIVSIRDILTYAVEHYPKEFINLPPGPSSEASRRWGG